MSGLKYERMTKAQLIEELKELRKQVSDRQTVKSRTETEEAPRESEARLRAMLSSMVDLVFALDSEGRFIFYHSPRDEDLYVPPEQFIGKKHSEVMPRHVQDEFRRAFELNRQGEVAEYEFSLEMRDVNRWFSAKLSPVLKEGKFDGSVAVVREITASKHTEQEREELIGELQQALEKVKVLRGLLPICALCKKIRDDEGYWHQVEDYIHQHFDAEFTHGLCPECVAKMSSDS